MVGGWIGGDILEGGPSLETKKMQLQFQLQPQSQSQIIKLESCSFYEKKIK